MGEKLMFIESEDKTRLIRQMSQEAINLAMHGRWKEAVSVNQAIVENMPTNIDAYNRLGKAYMELSDFSKAIDAYNQVLVLSPNNSIAQKNLSRLLQLKASKVIAKEERSKAAPHQFIGEMGKAGVVALHNLAPGPILAKMAAGDIVYLKINGHKLTVVNEPGDYIGQVEPLHGPRLAKLMEGGNKYSAAVVSVDDNKVKVNIREIFQISSQKGRLSFPAKPVEGFQPHVKDTFLRHRNTEEEELLDDGEEGDYYGEEGAELIPEGFSILEEGIPIEDLAEEELLNGEQ
jgi:tetratricopeptide (TPR) repeat protein